MAMCVCVYICMCVCVYVCYHFGCPSSLMLPPHEFRPNSWVFCLASWQRDQRYLAAERYHRVREEHDRSSRRRRRGSGRPSVPPNKIANGERDFDWEKVASIFTPHYFINKNKFRFPPLCAIIFTTKSWATSAKISHRENSVLPVLEASIWQMHLSFCLLLLLLSLSLFVLSYQSRKRKLSRSLYRFLAPSMSL